MKKIFSFVAACLTATAIMAAPTAAPTAPTYPANQVKAVYSATYSADCDFGEWGSTTEYAQEEFGKKYVTTARGYFGICFEGAKALNCLNMESLHLDVFVDADASLRVVPIHGGTEVGVTKSLTGGQWNAIDIALSEFENGNDWSNVYQIKIDNAANLTLWINNIYFYTTQAPATDTQAPTAVTASVLSSNYISATVKANATDNSGAVTFVVKDGENVLATVTGVSATDKEFTVGGLTPGQSYNLSLVATDESGNAAAAVALAVTTPALPALAAAPTHDAAQVLGIYSAHYAAGANISNYAEDWWNGPSFANITAGEDKVLYYYGNMGGCFGIHYDGLDVTAYETFMIDVYPATTGSMKIGLISVKDSTVAVTGGQWNHIEFPIAGNAVTENIQVGFYEYATAGEFLVQNILLVKPAAASAVENVEAKKAQKIIRNGQIFIIRNGVEYNALGQQL